MNMSRRVLALLLPAFALVAGEAEDVFRGARPGDSDTATFAKAVPKLEALAEATRTGEEKTRCLRLLALARFYAGEKIDAETLPAESAEERALLRRIAAGRARYETLLATRWQRQEARLKTIADRWVAQEGVPRAVADAAMERTQTRFRLEGSATPGQLEKELLKWALNKLTE